MTQNIAGVSGLTRDMLLAEYQEHSDRIGRAFALKTIPYYCRKCLEFTVEDEDETNGIAYLLAAKQELTFFDYATGNTISMAANNSHKATKADTNLQRPKSTNGSCDFCVEYIGVQALGTRVQFADDDVSSSIQGATQSDVVKALTGLGAFFDPGAVCLPPQIASPFMLEEALFKAVADQSAFRLEFGDAGVRYLGTLASFGQAGASSYLRAHGDAGGDAALEVVEGFLWARDGEPDADMTAVVELEKPVVVPVNLVQQPVNDAYLAPTHVWLDLMVTLRGFELSLPSHNQ
jgi:hypothetical protein